MIKLENTKIVGLEPAIRGMRNPMNSWDKSDSKYCDERQCLDCPGYSSGKCDKYYFAEDYIIGPNDLDLMKRLAAGGSVHAKYRRMIVVYVDITAPLYWWKEFKTYRAGRVFGDQEPEIISDYLEHDIEMNSCSTMHKIHAKEFELGDFSHEHLMGMESVFFITPLGIMDDVIGMLNDCRDLYLETKDKKYWWQMIQLLPSSYNQKRTVMLNYEVLHNIYTSRKDHKLDEWHDFCEWIEDLPYAKEVITCQN